MQTFQVQLAQMRRFRKLKENLDKSDIVENYKLAQSKGLA